MPTHFIFHSTIVLTFESVNLNLTLDTFVMRTMENTTTIIIDHVLLLDDL
jgi:hypothetical protein